VWPTRIRPREQTRADQTSSGGRPSPQAVQRVHVDDPGALRLLTQAIAERLPREPMPEPAVVVCVGSDRSTGDALGPLVGTRLAQRVRPGVAEIRGTLDHPVHAANLHENLHDLSNRRLVIAVDACLGRSENVGTVCVKDGALQPGTGVNKSLPSVGDFHIVGVVNVGGFMEYFVLQNTRLSLVVRLAELIADGLLCALERIDPESLLPRRSALHESTPQVAVARDV